MTRIALALILLALPALAQQDLRINQIQVLGTHNSYHAGFAPGEAAVMRRQDLAAFESLDYSHPPLDQQLQSGVRQLEIDIYADSRGGLYSHPAITGWVAQAGLSPDPPLDPGHVFDKPGFKVLHVAGVDQRSSCKTLIDCLTVVRTWSTAHPTHLPLFLLIETKYDKPNAKRPWAPTAEPFTPAVLDALDSEILSVFPRSEIITPDDVRGTHATLPEAIAANGWPTLAQSRGKVLFLMDQASMTPLYLQGHPALRGRILFTNSTAGAPDAAFIEQNSGSIADIESLVQAGYLVRTRADEPTADARQNRTAMRERALASAAQIISTDYPPAEPAPFPGHYHVEFPASRTVRCNPVTAPAACDSASLQP